MHASMKRLHEVSGRILKEDIASDLKVNTSEITLWELKGLPKEQIQKAAKVYGADANYISTGNLPAGMTTVEQMLIALPNPVKTPSCVHPSMERLFKVSKKSKRADIAADLGVSRAAITGWSSRGVSSDKAFMATEVYGADASYIANGILPYGVTEYDLMRAWLDAPEREETDTSSEPHPSMQRLMAVSGRRKRVDIAADLGVTNTTITNWSARGITKHGLSLASQVYGVNTHYIKTGELPDGLSTFKEMMIAYPSQAANIETQSDGTNKVLDDDQHPSLTRLHEVSGIYKKKVLASQLNVSSGTISNWATRGVSKESALHAAALYKTDAYYILYGDKPRTKKRAKPKVVAKAAEAGSPKPAAEPINSIIQKLPVVTSVSMGLDGKLALGDSKSWVNKPEQLSIDGFVFEVAGGSMSPVFNVGDHAFVETKIELTELKNGDFVIAQHKSDDAGILRQLIFGGNTSDAYLVGLNKEIPDIGILPFSQFNLIGKVVMKVTYFDFFTTLNDGDSYY